ncbi:MAG: hypothetical protein LKI59_08935 [Bacteroidales bacterium]|nr:hypothetical protein [Bacteroidales bacterium]
MKSLFLFLPLVILNMFGMKAQDPKKEQSIEEIKDSLLSRYEITLDIPSEYEVTYFDFDTIPNWTQYCPYKGHFMCYISHIIENKEKTVAVLLSPVPAFNRKMIDRNKKAGSNLLNRELYLISFCKDCELVTKSLVISETDTLLWSSIPKGLTLFSNSFPDYPNADDINNPTALQKLYSEHYPVLRRYYYIKKDQPPFSFIVLAIDESDKINMQINETLSKLFSIPM